MQRKAKSCPSLNPGAKSGVKLAADANVLLSALIGGQAKRALAYPEIEEIFTTAVNLEEVQEYAPSLARKRGLAVDTVLLAAATLPVTVVPRQDYLGSLAVARKRIGRRDPDDVELLALAIEFGIPVWSNDKDFEDGGVPLYTTASLLTFLESL